MDDLVTLALMLRRQLQQEVWTPEEVRALLRAGRALARERGCPGLFDRLLNEEHPGQPTAA